MCRSLSPRPATSSICLAISSRVFFARGIGVSRSGELTTRLLNLVPSIIECLRNDFDGLRIKNDRTAREFQNLRHGDPHCRTGGSATGLSAIDAWTKPLSMMAALCAQIRRKGRNRLRRGLRQISNRFMQTIRPFLPRPLVCFVETPFPSPSRDIRGRLN